MAKKKWQRVRFVNWKRRVTDAMRMLNGGSSPQERQQIHKQKATKNIFRNYRPYKITRKKKRLPFEFGLKHFDYFLARNASTASALK